MWSPSGPSGNRAPTSDPMTAMNSACMLCEVYQERRDAARLLRRISRAGLHLFHRLWFAPSHPGAGKSVQQRLAAGGVVAGAGSLSDGSFNLSRVFAYNDILKPVTIQEI